MNELNGCMNVFQARAAGGGHLTVLGNKIENKRNFVIAVCFLFSAHMLFVRFRFKPDLIKGDMDSVREDVLGFYKDLVCLLILSRKV